MSPRPTVEVGVAVAENVSLAASGILRKWRVTGNNERPCLNPRCSSWTSRTRSWSALPTPAPSLLEALGRAAAAARAGLIPVVYVRVVFRAGAPEVNRNNRIFGALANSATFVANGPATQIHPAVEPQPGDIVVDKKRVSAFAGAIST